MIHVYIDNEFDAVRMQGRYLQQVIAIGACLCDDAFVHIDSFYSLVCPAGFRRLSPHVRRMTHLKDTEIQKASKFPQVADRFIAWLQHYAGEEAICLYSFGPDDARTLCANAAFYHHGSEQLFAGIVDLQTLLSSRVRWRGEVFHKTHSLESLKQIYRIKGEVNHNALSDAIDLYHIHEAYRMECALDEEEIGRLYRTMRQKQVEGMKKRRRHQLERLRVQMADLLEQKRWQAIRALKQWDGFHAELITFAQQVQLSSVRSLRERPRPIQVQATFHSGRDHLRCWLLFRYTQECYAYSIDVHYSNVEHIRRFIRQWFDAEYHYND